MKRFIPSARTELPVEENSFRFGLRRSRSRWKRRFLTDPFFLFSSVILSLTVLGAASASVLFPGDPLDMTAQPLLWPGQDWAYPLGTDSLGRDLTAELFYGARASLLVGFAAAAIGLVIGSAIGALAGYCGGLVDNLLVRVTEVFQSTPSMLLVIVIVTIGNNSIEWIAAAIGIASWPLIARLVRAQFMVLRQADFVMAARSLGYSTPRIVLKEIAPNAFPPIVVAGSHMVANGILSEAGLSFLNLSDPNLVSWGNMIGSGRSLIQSEWYVAAIPGFAIILTVLALNILGDRITDVLSPRRTQN